VLLPFPLARCGIPIIGFVLQLVPSLLLAD
jgi:hypothetical protein